MTAHDGNVQQLLKHSGVDQRSIVAMADPNIAIPAALIGEPTRAAILMALCDGCWRAAGELAELAGTSAQSASNHLTLLREGGLVVAVQQGLPTPDDE
jgi:DNA-binding transcriptional ArsR family regulator